MMTIPAATVRALDDLRRAIDGIGKAGEPDGAGGMWYQGRHYPAPPKVKEPILRMKCAGKLHKRSLTVPEGASASGNGDRVLLPGYIEIPCTSPGPCYTTSPRRASMRPHYVNAKTSDTPCRARCTDATGDDCNCECGGANHGCNA